MGRFLYIYSSTNFLFRILFSIILSFFLDLEFFIDFLLHPYIQLTEEGLYMVAHGLNVWRLYASAPVSAGAIGRGYAKTPVDGL